MLVGFSQGACLTAEYLARHPRRFGGAAILTGALIGPPSEAHEIAGSLQDTPVLVATMRDDPFVQLDHVRASAAILARAGARLTMREYPGSDHVINDDEVAEIRALLRTVTGRNGAIRGERG